MIEKYTGELNLDDDFLSQKLEWDYQTNKDSLYKFDDGYFLLKSSNTDLVKKEVEDLEELKSFANFTGIRTIICDKSISKKYTKAYFMTRNKEIYDNIFEVYNNMYIKEFTEFSIGVFSGLEFDELYPYFARNINNGYGQIFGIKDNDKIIAGAFVSHFKGMAYLSFIAVDKEFRNKGLAKKLIEYIITIVPFEKIGILCEEEMISFYKKLGFYEKEIIYFNEV